MLKNTLVSITAFMTVSCIMPSEKKLLQDDLFTLKKEVLTINKDLADKSITLNQQEAVTGRRLSDTKSSVDEISGHLTQIQGEVDTIREAFGTGQLPGTSSETPSIAKRLDYMAQQITHLETTQVEIINLIEKLSANSKDKKLIRHRKPLQSLKEIKKAFKKKHYLDIVKDSPKLLKSDKKSKKDIHFYYSESLYKIGRLSDAAIEFSTLLSKKPNNYQAHINMRLGDCFRHLGDKKTAHAYYSSAATDFPKTPEGIRSEKFLKKFASR